MKIIIDIPDYNLDDIQNGSIACGQILKAVKNGTPLSDENEGTRYDCCYWNKDDKYCYITGNDHCPSDCGDYD